MRRSFVIGIALVVSIVTLGCTSSTASTVTRLIAAANVVAPLTRDFFDTPDDEFGPLALSSISFDNKSTLQYWIESEASDEDSNGFFTEVKITFTCTYIIGDTYQLVGGRQFTQVKIDGYLSEGEKQLVDGRNPSGFQICPPSE
jgi:hypothetical protein